MNENTLFEQGFYNKLFKGVQSMIAPDATWEEDKYPDENESECKPESRN